MLIYMVVPIAAIFIMKKIISKELSVWAYVIPILCSLLIIFCIYNINNYVKTYDTEYHGGFISSVTWDEHWTEQYTETETYTDSDGHTQTRIVTRTRYHPDEYYIIDSNNYTVACNYEYYMMVSGHFGNNKEEDVTHFGQISFNDGRRFVSRHSGSINTMLPCFTSHRYRNKVAQSRSVFNFTNISHDQKILSGLYDYPQITNFCEQKSLLGYSDYTLERKLMFNNMLMGRVKQLRIFVLVFKDRPIDCGLLQQQLWKNGNKNEVVVCIGLHDNTIGWVYPFAWDNERLLENIKTKITTNTNIDLDKAIDIIIAESNKLFIRKQFKDFDYIRVECSIYSHVVCIILLLVVNILWIYFNEKEDLWY